MFSVEHIFSMLILIPHIMGSHLFNRSTLFFSKLGEEELMLAKLKETTNRHCTYMEKGERWANKIGGTWVKLVHESQPHIIILGRKATC